MLTRYNPYYQSGCIMAEVKNGEYVKYTEALKAIEELEYALRYEQEQNRQLQNDLMELEIICIDKGVEVC